MTDARTARRAAEQAAREAMQSQMITSVGDLAASVAAQEAALGGVERAEAEGRKLVEEARKKATALVKAARGKVKDGEKGYTTARAAALAAGWSDAKLV